MSESTFYFPSSRAFRWFLIAIGLLTFVHLFERSFNRSQAPLDVVRSSFDWSTLHPHHPVSSIQSLPTDPAKKLRRVQQIPGKPHNFDIGVEQSRCKAVRNAAERAWKHYKEHEAEPKEQALLNIGWQDPFSPWSEALINSLDTLWIMGMKKEFTEAVRTVSRIDWSLTHRRSCSISGTTTRLLGGLLAAYDLSKEAVLLAKARELGDMLVMGFDTPNHLPPFWLDFEKAKNGQLEGEDDQPAASVTGLSLEFTRLSQLTKDDKYYDAVVRIVDELHSSQNLTKLPGLWPTHFDTREGIFYHENTFSLSRNSRSSYDYLLKMYAILGNADDRYEEVYRNATKTMINRLLFRPMTPKKLDIVFPGTFRVGDKIQLDSEIRQEACFAGGMFALGGRIFNITEHVNLGARLVNGCMWAYNAFPHGIMPESFKMVPCELNGCKWDEKKWRQDIEYQYEGREDLPMGFINARDTSYSLNPEAIESIFIMYRITGHEEYREAAWKMFQAIQKATESTYGNAAIIDVTSRGQLRQRDSIEVSFHQIFMVISNLK